MLERQIKLSRKIAALLEGSSSSSPYEVLPSLGPDDQHPATRLERIVASTYIIVLFRLRDPTLNRYLPEFISEVNSSGKIYISGTEFEGQPAGRFAIANWQADPVQGPRRSPSHDIVEWNALARPRHIELKTILCHLIKDMMRKLRQKITHVSLNNLKSLSIS